VPAQNGTNLGRFGCFSSFDAVGGGFEIGAGDGAHFSEGLFEPALVVDGLLKRPGLEFRCQYT